MKAGIGVPQFFLNGFRVVAALVHKGQQVALDICLKAPLQNSITSDEEWILAHPICTAQFKKKPF